MSNKGEAKTFFVGVKAVIVQEDKILLLKKGGERVFWDAPGGKINRGETIEQALLRELEEELPSIRGIKVGKLLHAHVLDRNIKDDVGLNLLFYSVDANIEKVQLSSEHTGYSWMTLDEASLDGSEGIAEVVERLRE